VSRRLLFECSRCLKPIRHKGGKPGPFVGVLMTLQQAWKCANGSGTAEAAGIRGTAVVCPTGRLSPNTHGSAPDTTEPREITASHTLPMPVIVPVETDILEKLTCSFDVTA